MAEGKGGDSLIWEISVAVIAAGFIVLVYYLVRTLLAAKASLQRTDETLQQIQKELSEVSQETVKLLRATEVVTNDIEGKLKTLDPLCQSIGQTGEAFRQITNTVRQVSSTVSTSAHTAQQAVQSSRISDLIKWTVAGAQLWSSWKKSRELKTKSSK